MPNTTVLDVLETATPQSLTGIPASSPLGRALAREVSGARGGFNSFTPRGFNSFVPRGFNSFVGQN